ncbi:MAG: hypothetical protein KH425_00220 [Prevotella bivia]|nr:hypothetical protein [Prevotella bivia]
MKKIFLVSLFALIATVNISAQLPVTDAASLAATEKGWAESLEKSISQINILNENKEVLQQSVDLYDKVSGLLKNSKMLLNILDRQVKIVSFAAKESRRNDFASRDMYLTYIDKIKQIIEESNTIFDLARTIVTPNAKMTDGERIQMLSELNKQTKDFYSKLLLNKRKFDTYNNAMKKIKRR